jgi:rhodanese-related sulfurtransferase
MIKVYIIFVIFILVIIFIYFKCGTLSIFPFYNNNIERFDVLDDIINTENVKNISSSKLLELKKGNSDTLIINILSKKYYNNCHISDSINIPNTHIINFIKNKKKHENPFIKNGHKIPHKDNPIIVYCGNQTCKASIIGSMLFKEMGYNKVYRYKGGMVDWFLKYNTEKSKGKCSIKEYTICKNCPPPF